MKGLFLDMKYTETDLTSHLHSYSLVLTITLLIAIVALILGMFIATKTVSMLTKVKGEYSEKKYEQNKISVSLISVKKGELYKVINIEGESVNLKIQ